MTPPDTPPDERPRKRMQNIKQLLTSSGGPRPQKPKPAALEGAELKRARAALREYDTTRDFRQRIALHAKIVGSFGCDADALRCRVAVAARASTRDAESEAAIAEAKAQLEAAKAAAGDARQKRGGRKTNSTLGATEVAVTPASKRGRPRATGE